MQAGAVETLFKAGIRPDMVLGSSIGALTAAWLAKSPTVGAIDELQALFNRTNFEDIFRGGIPQAMANLMLRRQSLFDHDGMESILTHYFDGDRPGDLELPCYLAATDIDDGTLHLFGDDPDDEVVSAVMSSAAIMPLQPPTLYQGRHFGDGGIVAALPLQAAVDRGATAIIGFNILTQLQPLEERQTAIDMLLHSIDLLLQTQVALTRENLALTSDVPVVVLDLKPDHYISILDMDYTDTLIARGREQAEMALPAIKEKLREAGHTI